MLSSQNPEPASAPADQSGDPAVAGHTLDGLIEQTRLLRDGVEAVRRGEPPRGARHPARRAVWDLAVDQLADFGEQLDQLRSATAPDGRARLGGRVGTAEWSLLSDGVSWSEEVYALFGRTAEEGPLTLDQLPSCLPPEDQPALTAAVAACLVDGRPMDCEVRITRPDGSLRTAQLWGEPVVDDAGGTVAMWAMVRDVSELRRSQAGAGWAAGGTGGAAAEGEERRRQSRVARAGRDLAIELAEVPLAPWLGLPAAHASAPGSLELAARYLPAGAGAPMGGKWYDALRLRDGARLLSVGDMSGRGAAAAASAATALGATRGIALTGAAPGALLGHLNQLLDHGAHPVLASAACCRFKPTRAPAGGELTWAQAGHPAPLLCRAGTARLLPRPSGPLLGSVTGASYRERTNRLQPGDVLVLYTDGLFPAPVAGPPPSGRSGDRRLADLGPLLSEAGTAEECLALIADACGETEREDDACLLVARVSP